MQKDLWYENKCNLCGKKQNPFSETHNFEQFKCGEKCSCGGEFMMFIEGTQIGGPRKE